MNARSVSSCDTAEMALAEAIQSYFSAAAEDRGASGLTTDAAFCVAVRDTFAVCADSVLTILLTVAKAQNSTLTQSSVEPVFRLLVSQVTDHLIKTLPELIATVEETMRASCVAAS